MVTRTHRNSCLSILILLFLSNQAFSFLIACYHFITSWLSSLHAGFSRKGMSLLWACLLGIGISLFTPVACTELAIDFLTVIFPGAQVVTKAVACYTATFLPLQFLFHLYPNSVRVSRHARIKLRYMLVTCLMACMIVWERCMVSHAAVPPELAANTLLAIITLIGFSDGLAVAAVYGEVAVLGPSAAHALVAGASAVMPLLSTLRIVFKAALPNTIEGLRLSLVAFYAAAVGIQIIGLACYWLYVLPAVTAVFAGAEDSKLKGLTSSMILVPKLQHQDLADHQTLDVTGSSDLATLDVKSTSRSSRVLAGLSLTYSLSLPSSMRGNSLLVRRFCTELPASSLRTGATAASFVLSSDDRGAPSDLTVLKLRNHSPSVPALEVDCAETDAAPQPGSTTTDHGANKAAAAAAAAVTVCEQQQQQQQQQQSCTAQVDAAAVAVDTGVSPFLAAAAVAAQPDSQASGHTSSLSVLRQPAADAHLQAYQPSSGWFAGASWASLPDYLVQSPREAAASSGALTRQASAAISSRQLRAAQKSGSMSCVVQQLLEQTQAQQPAQPRYFTPGRCPLASNWAMIKDNALYCAAMMLCFIVNYGIYPAFVAYVPDYLALGTWYPLLLATTYGICDLIGKLSPVWKPARPQLTVMLIAVARAAVFFPLFAVGLWLRAGPWFFFPALGVMALSTWFEVMIFCLATDGHHPDDAFQIEAVLAILLNVGAALGTALSFCWTAGPWAVQR